MNKQESELSSWIDEYHNGQRYGLQGEVIVKKKNKYQEVMIVETEKYGRGLLLDNCWMTTEGQEKQYHECLVHPAMCSAEQLDNILIIGGGDGGSARECLRYKEVKQLDLIEIDIDVIQLSQKYIPSLGNHAWKDPRLTIKIQNGLEWVANTKNNYYDVIIIDSSDPKGPAEGLFNRSFFQHCKRILKQKGVLAAQTESPEAFRECHIDTVRIIRDIFSYADPLYGSMPIYPSGWWSWTFAAEDTPRYHHPIKSRACEITNACEIWSPRWQKGSFEAIPAFIERELNK